MCAEIDLEQGIPTGAHAVSRRVGSAAPTRGRDRHPGPFPPAGQEETESVLTINVTSLSAARPFLLPSVRAVPTAAPSSADQVGPRGWGRLIQGKAALGGSS